MKKLLLLLSLCCSLVSFGQTGTYQFSRWVDTFVSIQGLPGTVAVDLSSSSTDDVTVTNIPIGFTFPYCGTNYTQFSASSNGWISLANTAFSVWPSFDNFSNSNLFSLGGGVGFIMPYWDDLSATFTSATTATAYRQTSGTAPNQVLTFQWGTPAVPWHSYLGFGDATFQVKLYQTSGVIEFVYGPSTFNAKTATIGIANNNVGDHRTLAHDTSLVSSALWHYSIDTTPAYKTVMEWAPPCPNVPLATIYTGDSVVCAGQSITLSNPDTVGGGLWISSSVSVATVGSAAGMDTVGIVTGVAGGVTNITYRLSPGCFVIKVVTVNPLPDTIGGSNQACENSTKTYTCTSSGGEWSSSNTAVGTIATTTGVFGGVSAGTTTISYTITATGCFRTLDVTVNSQPLISGWPYTCLTDTTWLTNAVAGGTWSSSNTARAVVSAGGGVIGVTLGPVIISYTSPSGCVDTMAMLVQTVCTDAVNDVRTADSKLSVYPQPTNGDFSLDMPVAGSADITVSDIYGKTIIRKSVYGEKGEKIRFNESSKLAPGNYILKLVAGELSFVSKLSVIK